MEDKEIAQIRACLDECDIKSYLAWKKAQEAKEAYVHISKEMLRDINGALCGYWSYLISDTRKARHFRELDKENYYRAAAGKISALIDDIAAALDPKE